MKAEGTGPLRLRRRSHSLDTHLSGVWKPANDAGANDQADIDALGAQQRVFVFCLVQRDRLEAGGGYSQDRAGMLGKSLLTRISLSRIGEELSC
jgi:hypothetical protein